MTLLPSLRLRKFEMAEWFVIGILTALLIAQQVQIQKLMNKLMSRNFNDYVQSSGLKKPVNESKVSADGEIFDPIAEKHAQEANSLFLS